MTRRMLLAALAVLMLVAGVAGCTNRDGEAVESGPVPASATSAGSVSATPVVDGASDVSTDGASANTAAIEAELNAVEAELGSMTMPSDSDFNALEGDIN